MPSTEGLVKGFLQQHLNQVTEKRESEPTVRLAPIFFVYAKWDAPNN